VAGNAISNRRVNWGVPPHVHLFGGAAAGKPLIVHSSNKTTPAISVNDWQCSSQGVRQREMDWNCWSDRRATVASAHRKGEPRRGSRAQARASLRGLRLALQVFVLIAAVLDCGSGYAKSYMSEFLNYQTICSVVEVNSDPRLEGQFDRDLINRSIASVAASRLHERRIDVPIESGRQCFPGKVGVAPRQLSLQFHVTVACGPHSCASMTLAVVIYTFYAGIERAPGSYPTIISYCDNGVELSNCLLQKVTAYFDEVVVPIFESVQQIRKHGTK
jgi:hypothetical protein